MKIFIGIWPWLIIFVGNAAFANVNLPSIFSDHMVLQQNASVKFWGWGSPLEEVTITTNWNSDTISTKVDRHANWEVLLKTPKAGGPYTITVKGYNEIKLADILIGEVWLCSGQSNMEWSAGSGITNGEESIKNADIPEIRLFSVAKKSADTPQLDLGGNWQVCSPSTMKYFSAVAYFFGKNLHENLNVPIGLINSSWGGTPAEIWMPEEVIVNNKELLESSRKLPAEVWGPNEPGKAYNAMIAPITGLKIAGVIWYQGETNTANSDTYEQTFSTLIKSWREKWNEELPFYYAQIAPFEYDTPYVGVKVRDAQRRTLKLPQTGMVITSDICTTDNIHPKNKEDVGIRFANIALKKHYKTIDYIVEGPLFDSASFDGAKVYVRFKNSKGLYLKTKTSLFEIAGEDGVFYKTKSNLKGGTIAVSSSKVRNPKFIRYAWGNTNLSNIFNEANLPASSFTTENP